MEFGKSMDVSAFDWDDTALIEEYDRIMKTTKKAISKSKKGKSLQNKGKAKENEQGPFEVGDYCRAMYKEDGLFYESTIIDIHGDTCTVEFLGYGDLEEVALESLEESNGRRARQKQRKKAKQAENYVSDSDLSNAGEREQMDKSVKPMHPSNNAYQQWDFYSREQSAQPYQPPYLPPAGAFNHTSAPFPPPPVNCVQRVGDNMQYPIPPPPIPQCSAVVKDPSLSAMLVSWYMAGYYTGLHQNQKTSHCSATPKTHCCDHHHHS